MKTCSFQHADFTESMKVIECLFKKEIAVKTSFTEKTFVIGAHWNCLFGGNSNVNLQQYVAENKENYLEIYSYQESCPLSLALLNNPNCQLVLRYLSLYCKLFIFA